MNRNQRKEKRRLQSSRQLMGIQEITPWGVRTDREALAFFLVQPDNLSVLSPEGIRGRVTALKDLLCSTTNVRFLALDSRETFQQNRIWYQQRISQEENPAIRELLRKDLEHLDSIQASTVSAREFVVVFPIQEQGGEDIQSQIASFGMRLRDHSFRVRPAGEQDVKRILAVYYQQDVTTEYFDNVDGERWLTDG